MRLVVKPQMPDARKFIFSEGIVYFETSAESIWGKGDEATLELLDAEPMSGKWLNLAAGDGRYNATLLRKAGFVVASDIDECALSKLRHITPKEYRLRLQTAVFNIARKFPFQSDHFDGVFCTGTLHLFPKKVLQKILLEIDRVLRPGGKIILDFATDVRRVRPDGKLHSRKSEPKYSLNDAKKLLKASFKNYSLRLKDSQVSGEHFKTKKQEYDFSCNFILMIGEKK